MPRPSRFSGSLTIHSFIIEKTGSIVKSTTSAIYGARETATCHDGIPYVASIVSGVGAGLARGTEASTCFCGVPNITGPVF